MTNRPGLAFVIAAGITAIVVGVSAAEDALPVAGAFAIEQAPVIDGALDDPCWQREPNLPSFTCTIIRDGELPDYPTAAWVGYDGRALYLAARAQEPNPEGIVAAQRQRDLGVSADDSIEVFIDIDGDRTTYLQFIANTLGTQYDGWGSDPAWNGVWAAGARVYDDHWVVEFRFPFETLGAHPRTGAAWTLNVCREHWANGVTEYSCWSNPHGGFHTPSRFGTLVFGSFGAHAAAALDETGPALEHGLGAAHRLARELPDAGPFVQRLAEIRRSYRRAAQRVVAAGDALGADVWRETLAAFAKARADLEQITWDIRFEALFAE